MKIRAGYLLLFMFSCFAANAQRDTAQSVWWKETVIYQIYPRSYSDSNGDGIGDLRGIINKLDYIHNMGFETIWVSPFYESPQADFGYDISNYYAIAPEYGTLATVDSLIAETHKRGMKIVFDLVLNHTSDQHPWFKESAASRTNPKADWYVWRDGRGKNGKRPPNNWYNVISQKGWTYSKERGQWYYSAFLNFQPDLNYRNPDVKAAMFSVVKHWLSSGVDGIRLDIFNCIMEDSLLRDNPKVLTYVPSAQHLKTKFQNRTNNINHPDNNALARELRDTIDTYSTPQRFMVGEAVGNVTDNMPLVGKNGDGLNMVFLFDMLFYDFKPKFFRNKINLYEQLCPAPLTPTIVFGNHDNRRSINRINNNLQKARLLALFQLTARGVPVIYYGEEIGMRDVWMPKKDAKDPISGMMKAVPQFMRKKLPVPLNRDICRTPMQWDTTANAGFSTAKPWLPIDSETCIRNVQTEGADSLSLLNTYKALLHLRDTTAAFKLGKIFCEPDMTTKKVLAFTRYAKGSGVYTVLINFTNKPQRVAYACNTWYTKVYGLNPNDTLTKDSFSLSPYGGLVVKTAN
jgi:oligo-1,6-glucosidase/alpha-glucosidase